PSPRAHRGGFRRAGEGGPGHRLKRREHRLRALGTRQGAGPFAFTPLPLPGWGLSSRGLAPFKEPDPEILCAGHAFLDAVRKDGEMTHLAPHPGFALAVEMQFDPGPA